MTKVPNPISEITAPKNRQWQLGSTPWLSNQALTPGTRVIIDNDFSGDPDDLFQLVHHLLSPSLDIRLVVASHLREGDPFDSSPDTAASAFAVAADVFARMGITSRDVIKRGSAHAIKDLSTPAPSEAVDAIIAEARADDPRPLFYLAGGGLTDLASALIQAPDIASRMTLIWIGGLEHQGLATPPKNAMPIEYNLLIDTIAGQVVFDTPDLEIWQVPRNVYRQCLVSIAELRTKVGTCGELGKFLVDAIEHEQARVHQYGLPVSESYALGDSPLVLLTALSSLFEPDSTSSIHTLMPTPQLTDDGAYRYLNDSRPMRVYTYVDTRLMFDDLYAKIHEFTNWFYSNE